MREAILHQRLAGAPWEARQTARLPGIVPVPAEAWLVVDEAYAGQMALRDALVAERRAEVIGALDAAKPAMAELFGVLLDTLAGLPGFAVGDGRVVRPDGAAIPLHADDPLGTMARLVAEDLCVLERPEGAVEHVLTAAALCFPAHWTLAEKLGHPLIRIHRPVADYDAEMARRVQRLFDGLRPGQVLMRMNAHRARAPDLFTPQREGDPAPHDPEDGLYIRSERQCLRKLPRTRAVVFSIQSRLLHRTALTPAQRAGFDAYLGA